MTYIELMTQVRLLAPAERLMLAEAILHWMREEEGLMKTQRRAETWREPMQTIPPASALRGLAKPLGSMPTDQELKEDYINYLEQKYL